MAIRASRQQSALGVCPLPSPYPAGLQSVLRSALLRVPLSRTAGDTQEADGTGLGQSTSCIRQLQCLKTGPESARKIR
jgi:hypothetical protein